MLKSVKKLFYYFNKEKFAEYVKKVWRIYGTILALNLGQSEIVFIILETEKPKEVKK